MSNIVLRDYQQKAVGEIRIAFRDHGVVLFVLPTGGGKTYTFCYIGDAAALKGRRVMIIVHRKELLKQASKSLSKLGIDHGLIAPWASPKPRAMVQVASVDSLNSKRGRAMLASGVIRADLLIFDEGHHVQADNKWGAVWSAMGEPKTLLVTASPGRPDFRGMGKGHGGIADVVVEGPSVPELIERGALIKPRVFGSTELPDIEGVKLNAEGDLDAKELAHRVDKPHLIGNAVKEYTEVCPGTRAVAFCVNVKHAIHVRDAFNAAGYRFKLLVGDKDMVSEAERTQIVDELDRGEIDGICTVDLVSEGFDCPGLVTCIMLRPTHSEIVFLQQAGRVMRPDEGKVEAFLLDHAGNVGRWVDGEFKVKHGFPSVARDWSQCLVGKKKKPRGSKKEVEPLAYPGMTQCKGCKTIFDVLELAEQGKPDDKCPTCGEPIPVEHQAAQRMPKVVEGRLGELDPEIVAQQKKEAYREQGKAQTVEELRRNLGYSRGRANHVLQARKEKEALVDGLLTDLRAWRDQTGQNIADVFGVATFEVKAMKPKQLRELRTRLDDHLAVWRAVTGDTTPALAQATIDF